MDTLGIMLVSLLCWAVVFGWLGSWVAAQCGRDSVEGLILGCLFGPFGVLIEALLPKFPRQLKQQMRYYERMARDNNC